MWKHRILYAVLVVSALSAYIAADRGEALVLLCMLVLVPFFSVALQAAAMRGIGISCRVQETCRMGQEVSVYFEVYRKSRLPLGAVWIHAAFENILYGEHRSVTVCLLPDEERKMTFVYSLHARDCGNVKIRVPVMECRDLLGLSRFRLQVQAETETMVYPPEIRLSIELLQRPETKNFGDLYDQQKRGQDVSEVSGLRDYIPGDSMNSIHWKLSGKMDKLIVREFGNPSNYNTLILYEMIKRAGGTRIPDTYNNAVLALTAAISKSLLELNLEHHVGRVFHRDFQVVPVYSSDTCEQMLLNLLCMPVAEKESGADMIYCFLRGNAGNDYTKIIYITPHYEEETARQLSREAGLTVIQIAQGRGMNDSPSAGYTLISVDADTFGETVHSITI